MAQVGMESSNEEIRQIARKCNDNNPVMIPHQVQPSQEYVNAKFGEDRTGTGFKHAGRTVEEVGNDPGDDSFIHLG
jgi:hypothetical protein